MAASTTLNARNLEKLGAAALAGLLIEVSTGHAAIKRRLRLALADVAGPDEIAAQVRKRLASVARAHSALDWRQLRALAADLATQHAAIAGPLAAADPAAAYDLLWHFLALANRLYERTDDSGDRLHDVFTAAVADLGRLAQAARITPASLADRAFDALSGEDHDHLVGLIDQLGSESLDLLQARILAWNDPKTAGMLLERIADAQGDADGWIAQQPAAIRHRPAIAAGIARRLLTAGRAEEAQAAIEAAAGGPYPNAVPDWDAIRLDVLEALSRTVDAQTYRWQRFERVLHARHLRDHLRRLPDFDDFEAEQRALAYVEAFPDVHAALAFLIAWPAPDRAARMVTARHAALDGDRYEVLTDAADRLDAAHPLAATILRRAMIDFALRAARSSRYGHAARHLNECAVADARIADHHDLPDHATYVAALSRKYSRATGFWTAVQNL